MNQNLLPAKKTYKYVQRTRLIIEAIFSLGFAVFCLIQVFSRFNTSFQRAWNSWWFFGILAMVFLYSVIEAIYRLTYARLVLSDREAIFFELLNVRKIDWGKIEKVGTYKQPFRGDDVGIVLKQTAMGDKKSVVPTTISLSPYLTDWMNSELRRWFIENQPGLLTETLPTSKENA